MSFELDRDECQRLHDWGMVLRGGVIIPVATWESPSLDELLQFVENTAERIHGENLTSVSLCKIAEGYQAGIYAQGYVLLSAPQKTRHHAVYALVHRLKTGRVYDAQKTKAE